MLDELDAGGHDASAELSGVARLGVATATEEGPSHDEDEDGVDD